MQIYYNKFKIKKNNILPKILYKYNKHKNLKYNIKKKLKKLFLKYNINLISKNIKNIKIILKQIK